MQQANDDVMSLTEDQHPLDPHPACAPVNARRRARVPRSTVALLFISIVLPLALFALAALQNRRDVEVAAERRVDRTTRILHEHALKVFETHQLMIDQLNERLPHINWADEKEVANLDQRLAHLQALLPQVRAILITDAHGLLRASSFPRAGRIDFSDRDWFVALKAMDQRLPFVSSAMKGKMSGRSVFNIAARARGPNPDVFDGTIAVSIDQNYFADFYRDTERDFDHLIVLAREDGAILASEPQASIKTLPANRLFQLALESRSQGFLIRPSLLDGKVRIFGYERVGAYPLVIGFGIPLEAALAPWWRNMQAYGLVALLSSLTLLGVSGFAIRRVTLEGRATMRWRRSAAQLETEMAERQRLEEQLRQSQKMEAVGRLTGGIAHDFNNLLTVVIGSLDLLMRRMRDADPRQQALVKNAIDGASRAATLTARLLAFSRQHPLDPKPLDANALVEGMSNLLLRTLSEAVTIRYALETRPWRTYADPNQLENAILNLCVNAVDAMPKGGTLTLATENVSIETTATGPYEGLEAGPYVKITVADTGLGMPPEVVARAFEPFFTTKPVGKGTGLGLSQVYGFSRQSGGHAAIESEPGRGTTIAIYLPRLRPAAVKDVEVATILSPGVVSLASASGATILLVEDDDLVRRFSADALREGGFAIIEASTGPDGLAMLALHREIALLFTDIVLKGPMDGRELADKVLALRPGLPVLFTTGYTKDALLQPGQHEFGALRVDFLEKPFTTAAVAAKIADLLGQAETDVPRSATG